MDDNSWQKLLTIAWCISIGASEALGTGHPLPHAVAHVARGRRHQPGFQESLFVLNENRC